MTRCARLAPPLRLAATLTSPIICLPLQLFCSPMCLMLTWQCEVKATGGVFGRLTSDNEKQVRAG